MGPEVKARSETKSIHLNLCFRLEKAVSKPDLPVFASQQLFMQKNLHLSVLATDAQGDYRNVSRKKTANSLNEAKTRIEQ